MRFVDSHLHLDGPDSRDTARFASSAGAILLACSVDQGSSKSLLELAESSKGTVRPFVGVHPSEALKTEAWGWLESAAARASGVGEVGLDPTYSPAGDGTPQDEAFRRQLEVARALAKPVQVHSRAAEGRVLEVLAEYGVPRVLMHWLESEEALPRAMDRGYFVSFGPALLYSKRLQRVALRADPALVLIETDSPVSYAPLGGTWGPVLIPSVAFKLAELRGARFDETLSRCNENALTFLGEKG